MLIEPPEIPASYLYIMRIMNLSNVYSAVTSLDIVIYLDVRIAGKLELFTIHIVVSFSQIDHGFLSVGSAAQPQMLKTMREKRNINWKNNKY